MTPLQSNGTGKIITFREGALFTELPVSAGPIPAGATTALELDAL